MIEWSQFHPYVLSAVPGCSPLTADRHISMAARDFCERTMLYEVTLPDVVVADVDVRQYQLSPTGVDVIRPVEAWCGEEQIGLVSDLVRHRGRRHHGRQAWMDYSNVLHLGFRPNLGEILRVNVAARPLVGATGAPDVLLARIGDIANGALASLMTMPKQAWTDPAAAGYHRRLYEDAAQSLAVAHAMHRRRANLISAPGYATVQQAPDTPSALYPVISQQLPQLSAVAGAAVSYQIPAGTFSDPGGLALTYSATALPVWAAFNSATRTLSGTPSVATSSQIVIRATNSAGLTTSTTMVVAVMLPAPSPTPAPPPPPTNLSPIVASPIIDPPQSFAGEPFSFQFSSGAFTDPNGSALTYSTSGMPSWMAFNPSTRTFTGTAAQGSSIVTVSATDPAGLSVSDSFTVVVGAVQPVRSVALSGTWAYAEGDDFSSVRSIYSNGMKPGDSWSAGRDSSDPLGVITTHTVADGKLKMWPTLGTMNSYGYNGLVSRHLTTHSSWTTPTNKRYFLQVRAKVAPGNGQWTGIWLRGDDFSAVSSQPEIDVMETGAGTSYGESGVPFRFTMNAWRDTGSIGGVAQGQTNGGLYMPGTSSTLTTEFHTWAIDCNPATGVVGCYFDGVKLGEFTAMTPTITQPMYLVFSTNFRTAGMDPGPYNLGALGDVQTLLTANNPFEIDEWHCWTQDVVVNQAPTVVTPLTSQTAVERSAFTYQFATGTFSDPAGEALTYSVTGTPSWLTFTPSMRTFSGTPPLGSAGVSSIVVRATDPAGLSVASTFLLTTMSSVSNQIPVLSQAIGTKTSTEDVAFSFQVPVGTFTDPDGSALTYSASGLPSWLTFAPSTRTFSGTPLQAHSGSTTTITVTATDPQGASASTTFSLAVTAVNDAPVVAVSIPAQTGQAGSAFSYQIPAGTFSDADGDTLVLTVSGMPSWMTWTQGTRTLSGNPTSGDVASSAVTVTATDPAGLSAQASFSVTIQAASSSSDPIANPVTVAVQAPAGSTTYNIGPGQTYTELGQVNWGGLVAGDVVNIFARSTPYVGKFGLRSRGLPTKRIIINGVTDANGVRPRITGANATTFVSSPSSFGTNWQYGENLGIIVVKRGPEGTDPYTYRPGFITIQNLDVYGADPGVQWTDLAGVNRVYDGFAAAIRVQQVEDIRIDNCWLHDSVFGLYTQQPQDSNGFSDCTDVLMTRCRIWNCGIVGSYLEHGVYTQARRERFWGNYFGPLKPGANGSSFKSRGAGTQVVGCTLVSHDRALSLDHDESIPGFQDADPRYGYDVVAYNLIINDLSRGDGSGSIRPIGFGADNGHFDEAGATAITDNPGMTDFAQDGTPFQRKARRELLFMGNTYYSNATSAQSWRQHVFDLKLSGTVLSPRSTAHVLNCAFHLGGTANYSWNQYAGRVKFRGGSKFFCSGVVEGARDNANPAFWDIVGSPGTSTPLGFVAVGTDFRPAAGSPLIGSAAALPSDLPAIFATILAEIPGIQPHSGGNGFVSRTTTTTSGAFEAA